MAPTLAYWNARGITQQIRLLLAYTETEFIDKRYNIGPPPDYDRSEWRNERDKYGLDFPNLPYYIDGNVKLTQSIAIMRYIARKNKLDGQNEEQKLRVDLVEQQLTDLNRDLSRIRYDPNSETLKVDYIKNLPQQLQPLSKFLGDRPFFAGNNVTYVDFMAYELLDKINSLAPGEVEKFDNLKKFLLRIESLPQIAKYKKDTGSINKKWVDA